jgi:hypothetical protein
MGNSKRITRRPARICLRFRWTKFMLLVGMVTTVVLLFEAGRIITANLLQKSTVATWGTIEKGCWVEGLRLREETLLVATEAGILTGQVEDGARVSRGEILALLERETSSRETGAVITITDRQQFDQLQRLTREEAALELDRRRINRDLAFHLKKIELGHWASGSDLEALKQEKKRVLRTIQEVRSQSFRLRQEIAPLIKRWFPIIATAPGYFKTEYDGYEGALTPACLPNLSNRDFERKYPLRYGGKQVAAGTIFGKLINPFNQVLAVKIDVRLTGMPKNGAIWRFKTSGGWKNAPIESVTMFDKYTGVAAVPLQMGEPDLTQPRLEKIFVVYQRITGVTIPLSALYHHDRQPLVRVARSHSYQEKPVQILVDNGSKAVVTGIEVGVVLISR